MHENIYDWLGEEIWTPSNDQLFAHLLNEKNTSYPITEEEKKKVDNRTVLGIMEGCYGAPGSFSGNGRFYPKECFIGEKSCLEDKTVKNKLESKTFFGTLGHEDKEIDEQDILEGKHAINTYKLWIDESTGLLMGRSYILNTKSGWNLYSAMKSGSSFKMSSRARGTFQEGVYKLDENGVNQPVVDPRTFKLFSFDVVFNPGIKQTYVNLKENKNLEKEKNQMNLEEQIKTLTENITLKDEKIALLEAQNKELSVLKNKITLLETELTEVKNPNEVLESTIAALQEKLDLELEQKIEAITELIEWRELSEDLSPTEYANELEQIFETIKQIKNENSNLKNKLNEAQNSKNENILSEEVQKELNDAEKIYSYIVENFGSLENIENKFKENNISEEVQKELNDAEKIYSYIVENFGSLENIENKFKENILSEEVQKELNDAEKIYSYIAENYGSLENIEKELNDAEKIYSYIVENFGSLENIEKVINLAEQKIISLQGGTMNKDLLQREAIKISESLNSKMSINEVYKVLNTYNGNLNEAEEKVFRHLRVKPSTKEQQLNEDLDIVAKVKANYIEKSGTLLGGYFG